MTVSVIVATCHRATLLDNMLRSLHETTYGKFDVETVLVIDQDLVSYNVAYEWAVNIVDYSRERRGALWAWNRALQICTGDVVVPAGDDQVFHENWLDYALESHKEKVGGYGVVGMNDLAYDGNTQVATMWLFDRKWCKDHMGGVFAPPPYRYYSVDREWNEKAKMTSKYYWDERSKIEHLHSAHGKRPVDSLDLEKQGWMEEDNKTFEERKAQGFPITWSPII